MTAPATTATDAVSTGPASLPATLLARAAERPDGIAFRHEQKGIWHPTTFAEYVERAARVASGLRELGVKAGDVVAIHSENRPEWVVTDLAVQGMGAVTVGVYPTNPAAEVEYLLSHSGATVLIAEDEEQVDKALEVRDRCPSLRTIVVIDPRGLSLDDPRLITFDELVGLADDTSWWAEGVPSIDPESCAIIVYTSGTTGPPKGAMLSHRNLVSSARLSAAAYPSAPDDEVLSYLPLCHIAERLFSVMGALHNGYVVNFGEGSDQLADDLRQVQPTVMLGVPRVWERMMAGVQIRMSDASRVKRTVYGWAERLGTSAARDRLAGKATVASRLKARTAWLLAHRSLRYKLGLSRMHTAISGAAPISPQVLEFFWAMGVDIREGYAQTENSAAATFMPSDDVRLGSVGTALPGVELRIADDGEVLTRSPAVFMGYLNNPEATAETVDADGWLHTGDVGVLDDDGYLTITDRKKDIIITAGGKNISPSEIENALKVSPFVREAVVVGDRRKYLTALIGVEPDVVGDWATRRDLPFTTYRDLTGQPEVVELVKGWVDQVNTGLAQVETIKQFRLMPVELDHEDGQLTATQKVKRAAIVAQFSDLIEEMYR